MELTSPAAEQRYAALVAAAAGSVVGLDFDGTLSPIVEDPTQALIHPDAGEVLVELAGVVAAIAVVTGRPARQAIDLGRLDRVADGIAEAGKQLVLLGQYGNERWSSAERTVVSPQPPEGLVAFLDELPRVLAEAGAEAAYVEDKGLAHAVHTRRLPDAAAAYDRVLPPLRALAERHGLAVEPGRQVVEVRAPGMDKGKAVRALVEELGPSGFLFAGDDLGDVEAFRTLRQLSHELPTLLVCSASEGEEPLPALAELADVVVAGPAGVLDLLRRLTADASSDRRR